MAASTTHSDPTLTRGVLAEAHANHIVVTLRGTDYRMHLAVDAEPTAALGKPVVGRIHASAKRVDVVRSGGRFIEPVYGRPRRLQGTVTAVDRQAHTLTVNAGCPFVCTLMPDQKPTDFTVGQLVAFDVERGARWEQQD